MKHRLVKLVAFLLLGAIVNVAVAWGCARLGHPQEQPLRGFRLVSAAERERLRLCDVIPAYVFRDFHGEVCADEYAGFGVSQSWFMPRYPNLDGYPDYFAIRIRCGWPLLCMEGLTAAVESDDPASPRMTREVGAWRIGSHAQSTPSHALPVTPIWPGFAINTVFYAAMLWGLFAAPFALRRRRRIKRGLCPKCAYDLRGCASQKCPECGNRVKATSVQPASA